MRTVNLISHFSFLSPKAAFLLNYMLE